MLKISLQKLPESHFGCSSWLLLAGTGRHKPANPWFEQRLTRKHEVFRKSSLNLSTLRGEFEADVHSDRIFARIFARAALICQLYEGNLRLTSILTAFLQASLHTEGATWLLMAGAGHPKLRNPWFDQL